jgi:hypothetical protein
MKTIQTDCSLKEIHPDSWLKVFLHNEEHFFGFSKEYLRGVQW